MWNLNETCSFSNFIHWIFTQPIQHQYLKHIWGYHSTLDYCFYPSIMDYYTSEKRKHYSNILMKDFVSSKYYKAECLHNLFLASFLCFILFSVSFYIFSIHCYVFLKKICKSFYNIESSLWKGSCLKLQHLS